jgi:two-component system phosphate regulon sensor histidine kinase PhoR
MRTDLLRSRAWQASLARLLLVCVIAAAIGLAFGQTRNALLVVLAAYAFWSLRNLYRLQTWLDSRRLEVPDFAPGALKELARQLGKRQRAERVRRRHLVTLLRAFRAAAQALPDGVVLLDANRRIQWINNAASAMFRLDPQRDRGRVIDDFLPNNQARSWIAGGAEEPLSDIPAVKDETQRLSLRLVRYAEQQQMLIVRDITKLMRLEQVRRDFVANVSHELRTPLTVLHGYLDMMEPSDVPQWAEVLDDLRGQSRRMAQIVEDLLTLSRLESPQASPEERVAMRPMLATLRREAEALSAGRQSIECRIASESDLRGSTPYLHSAFSNLVSNAVRYTPPGGRIELSWETGADGCGRFAVRDTGYGIPEQHLPRITERFYRVSTSRSRATGGTGLGLSIVKHALNLHQARLEIESRVGTGSVFRCVFAPERVLEPEPTEDASA